MIDSFVLIFLLFFIINIDPVNYSDIIYSFIPIIVYTNANTEKSIILSEAPPPFGGGPNRIRVKQLFICGPI